MWHDHSFSQRNRTTERTVGVAVRGGRVVGMGRVVGQNLKKEGVDNMGDLHKTGGVSTFLPTM